MSKATLDLIDGLDAADLADKLDRLYCYEQVVAHWCQAVDNRLTGPATFLLPDELTEVAEAARATGERLAGRIAQLGGKITANPSAFVARAPIERFEVPADPADLSGILALALRYERLAIGAYAALSERVRDHDVVTHRLLVKILAAKLEREDDIEAVLTAPDRQLHVEVQH